MYMKVFIKYKSDVIKLILKIKMTKVFIPILVLLQFQMDRHSTAD